jgi:type I restriction enzyme S subunit
LSSRITMQRLSELGDISRGVTYKSPDDLRPAGAPRSVQLLRATNIQGATIDLADVQVIDADRVHDRQRLATGDIAICIANGSRSLVGKAAIIDIDRPHEYVVGAFCARFRPRKGESSDLIGAILETGKYRAWIDRLLGTTTINNLKPSDIADCPVLLPSDQGDRQRLGDLLRTSRSLLHKTDALIAAKREQKRGLMQQLLTGKVRFPGFTEPWKTVRLGDVVSVDPEQLPATTPADYLFNYIDLSSVNNGRIELPTSTTQFSSAPSRARRVLKTGDVLLSTVRPLLKGFGILTSDAGPFVGSTGFAVLRGKRQEDARFVFECLFSSPILRQMHARTTGSSYPALGADDVRDLRIPWPSIPERDKIEALLTATTRELRLLEDSRSFLANERRGLMERLL